jgi:hypothetical protein
MIFPRSAVGDVTPPLLTSSERYSTQRYIHALLYGRFAMAYHSQFAVHDTQL